jgi:pilus assembly protein CpaB
MDLRRILIAFLLAAVLAGGITYGVYRRLRMSSEQRRVVQVVAAAQALPSGSTLAAKDLILVDWPSDVPLPGSFAKIEAVVGRPLLYPLGAKEPVMERDMGVTGSGIGLSGRITPGMRAVAVRSNEIVGVAGFLYPGSHVDVLATYNNPPGGAGPVTQTILQDVEVLTAGQTIEPDPQGKPQTVNVVTLLLNPEDSQKLQFTSSQGTIQFVLRNGADQTKTEVHPTRLEQLVPSAKPPAPPAPSGKRAGKALVARSAGTTYVLEVIQGKERNVSKFETAAPSRNSEQPK